MPKISALPPMTTAADDDEAPIVDKSVTTTKKWTLTLLKTYLQSLAAWITTAMLTDGSVTTLKQTASGCGLALATTQSVASGSLVALICNTEQWDTDGYHSTSSNTTRITIPAGMAGKYLFRGNVNWATNNTGLRFLFFVKNGVTTDRRAIVSQGASQGDTTGQNISCVFDLVAGDYIELYSFQSSGGALNANGESVAVGGTYFQCMRLGA